jgi:rRNA maturation RNase YbeY
VPELSVEVLDRTGRLRPEALAWLTQHIEKAVRHLRGVGEVRVRIVDDAEMAAAHEEFGGVEGTTDVLTFDLSDPESPRPTAKDLELIGTAKNRTLYELDTDILACLDVAERHAQGNTLGKMSPSPVDRELLLYAVHGVLHCLGMDDHDEAAAAAMHRVEDAVLTAIGIGPVYSGKRPEAGASG